MGDTGFQRRGGGCMKMEEHQLDRDPPLLSTTPWKCSNNGFNT